jgi:cytochrome P450
LSTFAPGPCTLTSLVTLSIFAKFSSSALPERFAPSAEKQISKGAYFPFGMGGRGCIGQAFAMSEAALTLATVAQRYRISLLSGQRVEPRGSMMLRPATGIRARFIARDAGDRAALPL